MSSNIRNFYRFREFRLEVAERRLLRDELPIQLMPKVFDVLAVLVERQGRLVEKDELLRIVWEDSFVEESNVARVVHSLRKILGEDAENKFIETVPKKGYRFVAEVEMLDDTRSNGAGFAAGEESYRLANGNGSAGKSSVTKNDGIADRFFSPPAAVDPLPKTGFGKAKLWLYGMLVFLPLSITGIWYYDDVRSAANGKNQTNKSIAVLPLKPISNENRDSLYELGIAESLILKLSSAKDLTVRPLSATRKYQELDQNPTAAGREQQVDFVLSSNYQIADGKIRVTAQLINIQTGSVEEIFKSEKDLTNIFLLQDALGSEIGGTILTRFGKRQNMLTGKRGTSSEEAYRLFLQASFIFDQWNKTEIGTAIEYLERAVRLDPNFAEAYIFLGYAYRFSPGKTFEAPREQYFKSKAAIEKALTLDAALAEAHAVSGMLKSSYESDFAGAEADFRRATELNPDSPMVRALYGNFLIILGRFDEALVQNEKAREIDPAAATHKINHGVTLYYAHRYDEAVVYFKKLIEEDKNFAYAYFWLWLLYDLQGSEAQAYDWFIKYQTQIKTAPETIEIYQKAYQKAGWKGILREIIAQDEIKIRTDNYSGLLYEMACFNARLGNKDKAFEYLEKSFNERLGSITMIKVDPYLDSLHGDPRFTELVRRIGLN